MSDNSPDVRKQRLKEIEQQARVLAEAYRLRLVGRLSRANLMFVVTPAVCATAAAIFAAGGAGMPANVSKSLAAGLAGLAAVLSAVHKSLKCEEYQAECLRLGSAYDAIAARADSAQAVPEGDAELKDLTEKFATLKESAKAPLPNKYIAKAETLTGYNLYRTPTNKAGVSPRLSKKRLPIGRTNDDRQPKTGSGLLLEPLRTWFQSRQ